MDMRNRLLGALLALTVALVCLPLFMPTAQAATAVQLAIQINSFNNGLTATEAGGVVTVTGNATATAQVTLNMDPGVTVNWRANYSGSLSSRYILVLQGAGVFNLSGLVSNSASGAISVTGAGGTALNINGGTLFSSGTGVTLNIAADNVAVNISGGGAVNSTGTNSAVNVTAGLAGVAIGVNGGSITSVPNGNAINDSGANTQIAVQNGGAITSGNACAIRSTGTGASVTVDNGTVTNAGTTAANTTIYMTAVSNSVVTVSGSSLVQNTHTPASSAQTPYAIQTGGNVVVKDSAVVTAYTRGINLVGTNSAATVNGGTVSATGMGTNCYAICTATENPGTVPNSQVTVTGGLVSSANGDAIHVTGSRSEVSISGGEVSSVSGSAVSATGSDAKISVSGGQVSSSKGNAIHAAGTDAKIEISQSGKVSTGGSGNAINTTGVNASISISSSNTNGSVVSATFGHAVNATGGNSSLTVNGGFVFAYGNARNDVIVPPSITISPSAFVITWNQANGKTQYAQSMSSSSGREDLTNWSTSFSYNWYIHPVLGGGINYSGGTTGFFPLNEVTVFRDFGLLFQASATAPAKLTYQDGDDYGVWDTVNKPEFLLPYSFTGPQPLSAGGNILTIRHFSWHTTRPYALTVFRNGSNHPEINLEGTGSLASFYAPDLNYNSYGINIEAGATLTITGSGILEIKGNTSAMHMGDPAQLVLPAAYIYWTNDGPSDPGGSGTLYNGQDPYNVPYTWSAGDKYFKISTVPFAVVNDVTISGVTGEPMPSTPAQTAVVTLYGGATWNGSADASEWFQNLPAGVVVTAGGTPGGTAITLTFSGTPFMASQAVFDITIPEGALNFGTSIFKGPVSVFPNPSALFDIQIKYRLIIVPWEGGSVTVPGFPSIIRGSLLYDVMHPAGTAIYATVVADPGYRFIGWAHTGTDINPDTANPAAFNMPRNMVTLTPHFEKITTSRAGGGSGVPKMGDGSHMLGWALTALLSGLAMLYLPAKRQWRRQKGVR